MQCRVHRGAQKVFLNSLMHDHFLKVGDVVTMYTTQYSRRERFLHWITRGRYRMKGRQVLESYVITEKHEH